jgi:hypothetical protein
MSPHIYAALMHAQAAELAQNAQRHHEPPRRARSARKPRAARRRVFGLLRQPTHA